MRFDAPPGLDLATLLKELPEGATAAEPSPGSYRIEAPVDPQLLAAVTAWCAASGILPERLAVQRRSLEDVFLDLTGRDLRQ